MNRSWILHGVAILAVCLLSAGEARAQVFTPTYLPPQITDNVGVYVSDGPGELAIEGIWRQGVFGLRAGYVDVADGALSIGGEIGNPIVLAGAPIGLMFTAGGQAIVGDRNAFGVQAGFSAGHTFRPQGANFTFTPYVHPRLALMEEIRSDEVVAEEDELDLEALAELGFQFTFAPNLILRFAANLGDGPDWGIGVAWRQ